MIKMSTKVSFPLRVPPKMHSSVVSGDRFFSFISASFLVAPNTLYDTTDNFDRTPVDATVTPSHSRMAGSQILRLRSAARRMTGKSA